MTSRDAVATTLSVSVPSELGLDWVGKAVSQFVLQFPLLHLHIEVATRTVNPVDQPYDLAINVGKLNDPRLVSRPVATLSRGIYASRDYVSRQGPPRTPDELSSHPFIVTDKGEREAPLILRNSGVRRRVTIEQRFKVNSLHLARELVLSGVGLAVLPSAMCAAHVRSGQLLSILADWQCSPVQVTGVMLARREVSDKASAFVDCMAEHLSAILAR